MKKVLIITSSIDCTVDYIIEKYKNVAIFCRLDVDHIYDYKIIIGGACQWTIVCNEWRVSKNDIYSIYYRKPRLPKLDDYKIDYRGMIARDIISMINGIVDEFQGKVLTKPYILRKTENKIYQLLYAENNKLKIPTSYIGNDFANALTYTKIKSIIKPITTGKIITESGTELYQTNYFENISEDISISPIYLQYYINKNYEVRLTYINETFFAVRIDSVDKLDWRRNYQRLKYTVIECPEEIQKKCCKLLKDFNLNYGAFDFIVNEKDEWIFLEVNPNGQWQWLEQELSIPISNKIIEYLID